MTETPDLVSLLYRADWTRLSLAAEVSRTIDRDLSALREDSAADRGAAASPWQAATDLQGIATSRSRLLVAPGRRYRLQGDGVISGSDGTRSWQEREEDGGWVVEVTGGPEPPPGPPLAPLLQPSWLLAGYALEAGQAMAWAGRDALRVTAAFRPGFLPSDGPRTVPPERVEVVVDAELGILLRHEEIFEGKSLSVTELSGLSLAPDQAGDDAQFHPPSGWDAARPGPDAAAAGRSRPELAAVGRWLGSGGLDALTRSWPANPFGRPAREEDPQAQMPPDEPGPAGNDPVSDAPVSEELLHLLHGSADRWAAGVSATVHQWHDLAAMIVPDRDEAPGMLGSLLGAAGDRLPVTHSVCRVRCAAGGQYRIAAVFNPVGYRFTEAVCDGQRLWKVYDDQATEGPAKPPPGGLGALFDTSWLLQHRLTEGIETTAGGRRGYLIRVLPGGRPPGRGSWPGPVLPDLVVIDAELGIVLRWQARRGSRTAVRYELRNVVAGPAGPGAFRPDLPPGLRVAEEGPDDDDGASTLDPAKLASAIAGQAAKSARSAVQGIMGIIRGQGQRPRVRRR